MQWTSTKRIQDLAWRGGKGDPLGIAQETELLTTWYIQKLYIVFENEKHKILGDFKMEMGHLIPTGR